MSPQIAARSAASLMLSAVAHEYLVDGERVPALSPVDLCLRPGEFVSLVGPSGCGKSTLLRIAGGLLRPAHGDARIDGHAPQEALRAKAVGFVFQDAALLPWRTVAGNVRLAWEVNRRGPISPQQTDDLLRLVGLEDFRSYYPYQLSGGMKQRVALARALAPRPSLLLMDEPFGALDEITRTELRYELVRLREQFDATILLVTHSIAESLLLSDRVVVMSGSPGRIVSTLHIDLPRPRTPDLEESAEFLSLVRSVRAALRGGV
jgi:NitT/TauT family transport system ATP-binding protein